MPFACSSQAEDHGEGLGGSSAALQAGSDDELALSSLRILGAKVDGHADQCQRCHDINRASVRKWASDYTATLSALADTTIAAPQRVNRLRQNPSDEATGFSPAQIGFMAAGAHFGVGANVDPTRHPKTLEQGKLLGGLFKNEDEYAAFRAAVLMPVDPSYERLTPTEYETLVTWVGKGLPKLDELLPEQPRPTTCTDDFTALAAHARKMRTKGWSAVNRERRVKMFACDDNAAPAQCFTQQRDGKDVFPKAQDTTFAKTWAPAGTTVRVLRELGYKSFYWTRGSADGRFIASGVSGRSEGGAVVTDLAAALNTTGPQTRDIWAKASYDPSFYPDNSGFMFQGSGAVYCAQSLLTKAATAQITFNEPECSRLGTTGLYQTIGQPMGDNAFPDRFIVTSRWVGDDGGRRFLETDPVPVAGPDAGATIQVSRADDNGTYAIAQRTTLGTPFEGDTMMSPSTMLLSNRVAGEVDGNGVQLGYAIREVTTSTAGSEYRFALRELGHVCMDGNKANFSYDERFLVTYHYLTRKDFPSDEAWAPYKDKGGSDIYIADFVTGEKVAVTHMGPGQFALFPHFRSDGWLYFTVRDAVAKTEYVAATDAGLVRLAQGN